MYKNKLSNYQGDCGIEIGTYKNFSDYIKAFSNQQSESMGIDIGAGPGGCNSKYFEKCASLDGCDADPNVVETLPTSRYTNRFIYALGQTEKLPYANDTFDFVICSCVIQHLNSFEELENGIEEISRVLQQGGQLFLMFKAGTNNTILTHFNKYYQETRSFRVFEPGPVEELCKKYKLSVMNIEKLVDENWIPYCCMTLIK